MEILRLDGLCKQYPAFRLDNVSFSMEAGTIMGLIGRNGAGKTTTLKSMLHLVHPDAGKITICALDMDTDERAIRSRIGFVSGGASYYQRKRLRELTNVTKDFYPDWDSERYARLVRQFSLDESKRVCELSEGMKVKYQLAVAMSHKAELLILDEPTSGLDPVSRDELLDTFLTLCEQEGVSILFSTHITSDLDTCADTITYIQNGRVAVSEKKQALTGAYLSVQGPDAACGAALREKLIGARSHKGELDALIRILAHAVDGPAGLFLAVAFRRQQAGIFTPDEGAAQAGLAQVGPTGTQAGKHDLVPGPQGLDFEVAPLGAAIVDGVGDQDIGHAEIGLELLDGQLAAQGVGIAVFDAIHDRIAHADVAQDVHIQDQGIGLQADGKSEMVLGLVDVAQRIGVGIAGPGLGHGPVGQAGIVDGRLDHTFFFVAQDHEGGTLHGHHLGIEIAPVEHGLGVIQRFFPAVFAAVIFGGFEAVIPTGIGGTRGTGRILHLKDGLGRDHGVLRGTEIRFEDRQHLTADKALLGRP